MKLYHGTTAAVARDALEYGLTPREDTEVDSNWDKHPSREDMVYLTRAYAPYFAMCATAKLGDAWGIVEIDTSIIDSGFSEGGLENYLYPDEDFLEQATRSGNSPCPDGLDMGGRTAWFRENLLGFQHIWKDSVNGLGNCALLGAVPAEAVTKVVIFEPDSNLIMAAMGCDPMITLMNYQLLGGSKYRALTDWFFGYDVELSSFDPSYALLESPDAPEQMLKMIQQQAEALRKAMSQRKGIEVLREVSAT